jgi:hypothetical protein
LPAAASQANGGTASAAKGRPELTLDSEWPSVPPAGPAAGEEVQVSIAGTFERLLSLEDLDVDLAIVEAKANGVSGTLGASDLAEVRSLFEQLAANHVRQVRDFMIDLRWSEATVNWIGICLPALQSLRRAADKLELRDLCAALDRFCDALSQTNSGGSRTVDGEQRQAILARYAELTALMPQAFALDLDANQREAVIVQSLLLQVRDVKKVTVDRIYSAGLTTLQTLFLATPGDVAAAAGIPDSVATRIVEHFRAYRDKVRGSTPDAARAVEREQIGTLVARLRAEHEEYERATQSWTREATEQKKELRNARNRTVLEIQLLLARLGEVERLHEVERLPFERKLASLEAFLLEARVRYEQQ